MSRSRKHPASTRPFQSVTSQMTFDHYTAVEESCAAELRGDWATAFERHRSVPMFAESHHGAMLGLLAGLGEDAPQWLVTRFLTVLAHRLEMHGQPRRSGRVLQQVVPKIYPHGIPFDAIGCPYAEQVPSTIFARDWVVRQVDVYDLGGLSDLVSTAGSRGAVGMGSYVADWSVAAMGGYRIEGADGEVMSVADALTGEEVELLDLGFTAHHEIGTHVLGRIVPTRPASGSGPGLLFDWQPLPVDQRIAREVAGRPERWLDVIAARAATGALPAAFAHLPEASMSSDLPQHAWASLLGHPIGMDLPRPPSTMIAEALKVALTLRPPELGSRRHLVGELLVDELLDDRLLARFATPGYLSSWRALAAVVPEVARKRCGSALWMIDAASFDDDLAG